MENDLYNSKSYKKIKLPIADIKQMENQDKVYRRIMEVIPTICQI